MPSLDELRKKIEDIDEQIIELIKKRVDLAFLVAQEKKKSNMSILDISRENEIMARVRKLSADYGLLIDYIEDIFLLIISMTRNVQGILRVAYLGPEGTFSEIAVLKRFGYDIERVPVESISEVFDEVSRGKADIGVVPIENSYGGTVVQTLDEFIDSHLKIVGELYLKVHHSLLANVEDISEIKKVYSHPQALAQCKEWLRNNLPGVELIEARSTSEASLIASKESNAAAIGNEVLSRKDNLKILKMGIEDDPNNTTRFWIIGDADVKRTGDDKTTILCYIKDRPGALFDLIKPFKDFGVNMTKIESRPSRLKLWDYLFFIDFEGHVEDENIKELIREVEKNAAFVKIIGSYPKGIVLE